MHTAQQPYGYPPQAPQVPQAPQAPQAPPPDVSDVGHRFSEMFESPSWTDSTASKQLYQNQEYLQKILDMVKQGSAQGPST
ncbi:hypothetical protein NLI96_g12091 [Meripilus lineatus]|uniref:Uncharacterized protein n=1 Tax=Meripilus lineatus TaxID=2056292 RepID=A0AAD5YCR1_9APHY|nr:hypothetical protein NLI96_g12091 [Physisporinus lineatus]